MLKFFLRKLHVFTICFFLLHVQINLPLLSTSSTNQITPTSWIKVSLNEAQAAEFKPQKIDTVDYISLITMIAVGIVAAGLIKACGIKANYEVYIFAGGALVYILGEIAVNASYKDIKDKTIEYNESGKLSNEQEKALKDLKKSYEDIKNISQIKQMLQLAAGAAFLTAAGIATYKWIKEKAALKACEGAIITDIAKVSKCNVKTPPSGLDCGACTLETGTTTACLSALKISATEETKVEIEIENHTLSKGSLPDVATIKSLLTSIEVAKNHSCDSCTLQTIKDKTVCTNKHLQTIANSVACNPADITAQKPSFYDSLLAKLGIKEKTPPKINSQIFDKLLSAFIPPAHADGMGAMLGIGAAGMGILAGLIITKKFWVDKLVPFPNRRAILFGACGALAATTALLTSNIKKKAQSNIDKINKILDQYGAYDNATTTDDTTITSDVAFTRNGKNVYGKGVKFANGQKLDCLATTGSGACANYNDLINNSKKESDASDTTEVEGLSIDPSLMTATNALGDGVNGVQGQDKISGETLGKFAQVAASQGAARSFLDNVRKKLNAFLKDNDEDEIDFAQQEQQTIKEMQEGVAQQFSQNGGDPASAVGNGALGPAYQQELKDAKQSDAKIQNVSIPFSSSSSSKKKSYQVRDLPSGVHDGSALGETDTHPELEGADNSINSIDGPSLWELLMHRYHAFWPRFMPLKKEAAPSKKNNK